VLKGELPMRKAETVKTQLILADAEDVRREELAAYHASCRTLDRETRKLKAYEDEELPGFLTWVQSEFAEELAQVHEWTALMHGLEQLIDDVERYVARQHVSRRVALDVIESAMLDGTYESLWIEPEEDEEEVEEDGESFREERYETTRAGATRGDDVEASHYVKSLYRKLVRLLHPDMNAALADDKTELWHEVQDAYSWRDIGRLERLYQKVADSAADADDIKAAPIRDLQALRRAVEANLKRIRQRIRESQKHIAWGFRKIRASKTKLERLRIKIGRDIAHDLMAVRMRREELEELIERWRRGRRGR
jgi:hypothetical protein